MHNSRKLPILSDTGVLSLRHRRVGTNVMLVGCQAVPVVLTGFRRRFFRNTCGCVSTSR